MTALTLQRFKIRLTKPETALILVSGDRVYKKILEDAFHHKKFSTVFDDRFEGYDWGSYLYGATKNDPSRIREVLALFQTSLLLGGELDQIFALSFHYARSGEGVTRTEVGQLVRRAKAYTGEVSDRAAASELARRMTAFVQGHPSYRRADLIVSLPPTEQGREDLPSFLAAEVSGAVGIPLGAAALTKRKRTAPQKNLTTARAKVENMRGAFAVPRPAQVQDSRVILIDDIYQSGATLNEAGRTLLEAGASAVLGLVATKTRRDVV